MKHTPGFSRRSVLFAALKYSFPVFLGYVTIGIAFGLMVSGTRYPWWLAPMMSIWMYAGAAQFIAIGLFTTGTTLLQACLIQLVVNARHIAYGLSMLKRFEDSGRYKPYLIFSLSDETFALLSSLDENNGPYAGDAKRRKLFMFYVSVLDQCYWVGGTLIGTVAGHLIPFDMRGISFALTALFVVLVIEQLRRVKKAEIFIVSGIAAILGVFILPSGISLLAALILALVVAPIVEKRFSKAKSEKAKCAKAEHDSSQGEGL